MQLTEVNGMGLGGEALVFEVNDVQIAAQRWNNVHQPTPTDTVCKNVLCLHGWLDNSASFQRVAPLLSGYDVVAFDMAGHGESSHRSLHGAYNIWDDLEDIFAIADSLGWKQFHLVGHSRGAFVSLLTAVTRPERVAKLVLLDGFLPLPQQHSFEFQLRLYLNSRQRLGGREAKQYACIADAMEARQQSTRLNAEDLIPIVERDLLQVNDGLWRWRHDSRLRGASAVKMSAEAIDSVISALEKELLLIVANGGLFKERSFPVLEERLKASPLICIEYHEGCHHLHADSRYAQSIAKMICQWLA